MQRSTPFARSIAMMSMIAAAMAQPIHLRQAAMAAIGPYESRGKGKGGPNRKPRGAHMAGVRAARKASNVRRNRAMHR